MSEVNISETDEEILEFFHQMEIATNVGVISHNVDEPSEVIKSRVQHLRTNDYLKHYNYSDRLYLLTDKGQQYVEEKSLTAAQ